MTDSWARAVSLLTGKTVPNGDPSRTAMGQLHRTDAQTAAAGPAVFLNDSCRRVDFVLAYHSTRLDSRKQSKAGVAVSEKAQRRAFFEANLMTEGLILEKDEWKMTNHDAPSETAPSTTTVFVKVHATFSALCRHAERLNMKVPLKLRDAFASSDIADNMQQNCLRLSRVYESAKRFEAIATIFHRNRSQTAPKTSTASTTPAITIQGEAPPSSMSDDDNKQPEKPPYVTDRFRRRNVNMYAAVENQDQFFTPIQRIEIVWEILQKARNDERDPKKRGIELLVETGIYECAFPLHERDSDNGDSGSVNAHAQAESAELSDRQRLRSTWANWKCIGQSQPLKIIRKYYGEKVAFYFAFLGFYTNMLLYPSIFGLAIFLYGLISSDANRIIQYVCSPETDRIMCPICQPPSCGFTNLSDACTNATWSHRVDNPATLVLACFTVVWATVFLKLWKRREAELAFQWDTYDITEHEDARLRPGYEQSAPVKRSNPVTKEVELHLPTRTRFMRLLLSTSITVLILCVVGIALACLVMGRIELYRLFKQAEFTSYVELGRWTIHGLIFLTVFLFDVVYDHLARRLTSLECPRTSGQWLTSLLWKVFIFELLNNFIPCCYVAFLKGKTTRTPSEMTWHSEMCEGGGCLGEVTELVAVLLLARLIIGNAAEIGIPFVKRVYARTVRFRHKTPSVPNVDTDRRPWRLDYVLGELELDGVAEDYMEMIVQFAYCTLFVPSLPVAPLLCFLNNILEIRIDAINLTAAHRRPLPVRAAGIGIWFDFLNIITKLAVFCNAGLIAFTSQTVQRLHYSYSNANYSESFDSYQNASLSMLPASNWTDNFKAAAAELPYNITGCWYSDYRYAHYPYNVKKEWWQAMSARVATFAAFVLASFSFQWFFNFVVSDVPTRIKLKIQRRRYVVTKATEASGAYDLWLSKAVRREATQLQATTSEVPVASSDNADRLASSVPGAVRSEEATSQISSTKAWNRVTGTQPPAASRKIASALNQKTFDVDDFVEKDT